MGKSHSLYFEFMDCTFTLADRYHITPFELYQQDCEEVIMTINFFVAKADEKDDDKKEPIYDGFWDF